MSLTDARLTALYRLLDKVDGAEVVRVQEAIRQRRRELELEDDPFEETRRGRTFRRFRQAVGGRGAGR